jgi:hypothetical protein
MVCKQQLYHIAKPSGDQVQVRELDILERLQKMGKVTFIFVMSVCLLVQA